MLGSLLGGLMGKYFYVSVHTECYKFKDIASISIYSTKFLPMTVSQTTTEHGILLLIIFLKYQKLISLCVRVLYIS